MNYTALEVIILAAFKQFQLDHKSDFAAFCYRCVDSGLVSYDFIRYPRELAVLVLRYSSLLAEDGHLLEAITGAYEGQISGNIFFCTLRKRGTTDKSH